jgi:hypothetical protein
VQLDLGVGPILTDGCGWDDAHILARLATMSPAEVGWMRARFEEDRPYLDMLDAPDFRHLACHFGGNLVAKVVKKGTIAI